MMTGGGLIQQNNKNTHRPLFYQIIFILAA
jgi:hypothetical protein